MPPKDIRSFFGGAGAKAGSSAGASKSVTEKKDANTDIKASPAKKKAKSAPAKPSAKRSNVEVTITKTPPKKAPATPAKKRKLVVDSDSESEAKDSDTGDEKDDVVLMDTDDEKPKKSKAKKSVVQIDSDDDAAEVLPPPKKRQAPEAPKRSLPSSLATTPKPSASKASQPKSAAPRRSAKAAKPTDNLSAAATKAIAAVEEVAKRLPSREELLESGSVTTMAEGGVWGAGGGEAMPENHGHVDYPSGHPDCLCKYTIVVSGVLESMMRQEAIDFVKRHGGRVTGSVSGRTSFLLCGKDTGNSKFNEAKSKGTKLLTEKGLIEMVRASVPFVEEPADEVVDVTAPAVVADVAPGTSKSGTMGAGSSKAHAQPRTAAAVAPIDPGSQLWVDKWKPKASSELVGNPQGQQIIRLWIEDWERVHIKGEAPRPAPGAAGQRKDMTKKALLISGPPGTGKTTASHIISKELGFEVVEVNASDTRNKSDNKLKDGINGKLSNRIKELVNNRSLVVADGHQRRQVLVMDEVDGMSGGDRGGVSDLIASIKASKMPIICVCNDKYKQSLKSLKNHCLEIDWRKPLKTQVLGRLQQICRAEGLNVNTSALEALIDSSQGDLRMILGQLQMHRVRASSLSYDQVRGGATKDMDKSPFDCARRLLSMESASLSMADRMECVFQDMDLVPLLVQENYVNHRPAIASGSESVAMQVLSKAADAFSDGDLMNRQVRMRQQWHLMPAAALLGTVYPAAYMRGSRETFNPGEMNFPRFTAWLGSNSSAGKQKRIAGELTTKLQAAGVVCDRRDLRLQYLPTMRSVLTHPLTTLGADGIDTVVRLMQQYLISRDDFDAIMDITRFKTTAGWGADPMKAVETKVKSAFTRTFNKAGLAPKTTIMVEDGKKGKGGARAAAAAPIEEALADGELAESAALNAKDEEEAQELTEADIKTMQGVKFVATQPKGKAKAKGGAGGAGRGKGSAKAAGRGTKAGRGK